MVVITNVRQDHLDVMGPTLKDIARHFISSVPQGSVVFTAERELFPFLEELAAKRNLRIFHFGGRGGRRKNEGIHLF